MSKHRHQHNRAQQSNHVGESQSRSEYDYAPNYEDVQRRAYQIHEEKGGSDLENWLEAEQALKEEHHMQ